MEVSLAFTNIQQATQEFQQQAGGSCQRQNRETVLFFPATLGSGYLQSTNLREGLDLFIYECDLRQKLILDFRKLAPQNSIVSLTFCLSGKCSGTMPGIKEKLDVYSRQTIFSAVPYAAGTSELLADHKISVVELTLSPSCLLALVESELSSLPIDWQQRLKNATSTPCFQSSNTLPELEKIVTAILYCPHQGAIRQLYLEGKALELIALHFAQLMGSPSGSLQLAKVKRKDLDSLHQAKNILLESIDDPPSLAGLARQVGLTERKLQKGFQQLFGTTVFGVLHDYRMERARQLLESNQMTIGAIADRVGISHRGYFATAFKRKFGSTPREYLKRLK